MLFFSVLLVAIGLLFQKTLQLGNGRRVARCAGRGMGRGEGLPAHRKRRPVWIADPTDPEEAYIVERLRHVYMLADGNGKVLEHSQTYDSIGIDSPQEIARILNLSDAEIHVRRDADGVPYMIKAGVHARRQRRAVFLRAGPFDPGQPTHGGQLQARLFSDSAGR